MKQISTIFIAAVVLIMTSCNNQPKPAAETIKTDTVAKPAPPVFKPYKAMIITRTVKDYDKWYAVYTSFDSIRKSYGITESAIGRGLDNDKWVLVFNVASDIDKAKEFGASAILKDGSKRAGTVGASAISYVDVIRDDTSMIPQKERIMVSHHVKDFDTWVKAYDAEGMATRAANGMIDRGMTRNIDDPNTVTLLFAITDMAKAKARVGSPELKKIMTDAGVDSPPQITYFKWIN